MVDRDAPHRAFEPPGALVAARARLDGAMSAMPVSPGVTIHDRELHGRRTITAATVDPALCDVLYLHGGGFRMGAAQTYAGFASVIATQLRAHVHAVDYALAPENPFPTALLDVVAAADALIVERRSARREALPLIVLGDSAGGGLAASLLVELARRGTPADGGVLLCPWLDLRLEANSFHDCAETDELFSLTQAQEGRDMYLRGHDPRDPLASPALADWSGQPPILVQNSLHEVLRDDARLLVERLRDAGVVVQHEEYDSEPHVWHYAFPSTPGSRDGFASIGAFVSRLTGSTSTKVKS